MVDSIGSRPRLGALAPLAPATRVPAAAGERHETTAAQLEASAVGFGAGFDAKKTAAINEQHVADVRRAVRDGTYPLIPETVADRLLALKLDWSPKK